MATGSAIGSEASEELRLSTALEALNSGVTYSGNSSDLKCDSHQVGCCDPNYQNAVCWANCPFMGENDDTVPPTEACHKINSSPSSIVKPIDKDKEKCLKMGYCWKAKKCYEVAADPNRSAQTPIKTTSKFCMDYIPEMARCIGDVGIECPLSPSSTLIQRTYQYSSNPAGGIALLANFLGAGLAIDPEISTPYSNIKKISDICAYITSTLPMAKSTQKEGLIPPLDDLAWWGVAKVQGLRSLESVKNPAYSLSLLELSLIHI